LAPVPALARSFVPVSAVAHPVEACPEGQHQPFAHGQLPEAEQGGCILRAGEILAARAGERADILVGRGRDLALGSPAEDQRPEPIEPKGSLIFRAEAVAPEFVIRPEIRGRRPAREEGILQDTLCAVREDLEAVGEAIVESVKLGLGKGLPVALVRDALRVGIGAEAGIVTRAPAAGHDAEIKPETCSGIVADAPQAREATQAVILERSLRLLQPADAIAIARKPFQGLPQPGKGIGPRPGGAGDRACHAGRTIRAALDAQAAQRGALALPRDDVDDSANRIRAIKRRLRPTQDLDPLDDAWRDHRGVELARGCGWIADAHAIEQDEGVAGIGTAHANAAGATRPAIGADIHPPEPAAGYLRRNSCSRGRSPPPG